MKFSPVSCCSTNSAVLLLHLLLHAVVSFTRAAEYTGYLIDKQCLSLCEGKPKDEPCAPDNINVYYEPNRHTKWCLLLEVCVKSGYVLLAADPDPVTGRHEILVDFTSSPTVSAKVLEFIQSGTTGTAPLVEVEFDDALLLAVSTANTSMTVVMANDAVVVRDPWDDEVASMRFYGGADTHQVECLDSTTPNIETNNMCFRSDVVVTALANNETIRIESNGCPDHKIMQGSKGVIVNTQPDPKPTTNSSSSSTGCGACGACSASSNSSSTGCGACGACSATSNSTSTGSGACGACSATSNSSSTGCGACGACSATSNSSSTGCGGSSAGSRRHRRRAQGCAGTTAGCGASNSTACGAGCGSGTSNSTSGTCGGACGATVCDAGNGTIGSGCSAGCGSGCSGSKNSTSSGGCGSGCGAGWTAKTINITWEITTYGRMSANVGDSIVFTYTPIHNLAIHKNVSCDEIDSVFLAAEQQSPFTYVVKKEDVGELTFACQVSGHCMSGQLLTFDVTEYSATSGCGSGCGSGCAAGCGSGCGTGGGCSVCGDKNATSTDGGGSVTPHFQHYVMDIPSNPGEPSTPVYFTGDDDVVGILANGVVLDSHKATWSYDSCVGHSDGKHQYHYHLPPLCFLESVGLPTPDSPDWWINDAGTEVRSYSEMAAEFPTSSLNGLVAVSPVIGFARDGFPIFGTYDDKGKIMTAADLDECNGKLDSKGRYGYYLTVDPPFSPPCLRGKKGTFSYRTTDVPCPSEGVTNLFIEQKAIVANCETVTFGSAPDCAATPNPNNNNAASSAFAVALKMAPLMCMVLLVGV